MSNNAENLPPAENLILPLLEDFRCKCSQFPEYAHLITLQRKLQSKLGVVHYKLRPSEHLKKLICYHFLSREESFSILNDVSFPIAVWLL